MQQIFIDRLNETTTYMLAHPKQHDQTKWHCGTAHCWAGFGDLLEALASGRTIVGNTLNFVDRYYYGLSANVWWTVTKATNTRENIVLFVKAAISGDGEVINLTGVDLAGANLSYVDLSGANLSGANLTGANLTGANLTDANFDGADLSGANLTDSNFAGVDLSSANVSGVNFWGELRS